MTLTAETMGARDRSKDQMDELFGDGWPSFITADQVVKEHIGEVRRFFANLELVLLDGEDVPVAAGWAVPLRWDGEPAHLPAGYSDSLARAVEGHEKGEQPNTLVGRHGGSGPPWPAGPGSGRRVPHRDARHR